MTNQIESGVMAEGPNSLDNRVFVALRTHGHPRWLERAVTVFSITGNHGFFWLGMAAIFVIYGAATGHFLKNVFEMGLLALVIYVTLTFNWLIKVTLQRERPRETDPRLQPLVKPPSSKSFPSSHAAMSFASASVLTYFHPQLFAVFFVIAIVLSWSRVYVGVHYPSDVLAGTLVGLLAGAAGVLFINWL